MVGVYGSTKGNACLFCGGTALSKNVDGAAVCKAHKDTSLSGLKCNCGLTVDIRQGKYGAFATCPTCGIVKLNRLLEMSGVPKSPSAPKSIPMPASTLKPKRSIHDMDDDDVFSAAFGKR